MTQRMMPMEEILTLTSTDYWEPVGDILPLVEIGDEYHQRLARKMRAEKINKVPIYIWNPDDSSNNIWDIMGDPNVEDHRILGNGHHRVKIAYEDGWPEMLVTDDGSESGWGALDKQVI
jgi:hypothetical protein